MCSSLAAVPLSSSNRRPRSGGSGQSSWTCVAGRERLASHWRRTLGRIELHAVDIESAAARCARVNVNPVGGQVYEGDLFEPLPADLRGRVDLLVANAPYVPTDAIGQMPPEARDHEPQVALDGGDDGLDVHRRIAAEAAGWLSPAGHLLVETSARQSPATLSTLGDHGLDARVTRSDELDATVVIGRRQSNAS